MVEVEVDYNLLIIIVGYSKDIGPPARKQQAPVPAKVVFLWNALLLVVGSFQHIGIKNWNSICKSADSVLWQKLFLG